MFENNLHAISSKFKRLSKIHFAKVSKNFSRNSCMVTITRADGSEHYDVVSSTPEQK